MGYLRWVESIPNVEAQAALWGHWEGSTRSWVVALMAGQGERITLRWIRQLL